MSKADDEAKAGSGESRSTPAAEAVGPLKASPNATAKIRNTGIRHRLMNNTHGNHIIEKGEEYELPLDTAILLLVDHDEFELVSVSGADEKAVRSSVKATKKARQEKCEQRAKMLQEEQEELEAAEEASSRSHSS